MSNLDRREYESDEEFAARGRVYSNVFTFARLAVGSPAVPIRAERIEDAIDQYRETVERRCGGEA